MKFEKRNNKSVAIIDKDETINGLQDVLDLMANARYNYCESLIVCEQTLGKDFLDLKTGYAGEVLQKFSNYDMRIAIVGNFSDVKSKSLRDFIYECIM
ncbi:MAG: DUF4180 domain-containing protein [Clostridiales bacterium]|nr:DUF4180 domain-containing protein [Clostridiales bacterium]